MRTLRWLAALTLMHVASLTHAGPTGILSADLDGDGLKDEAALDEDAEHVVVAIRFAGDAHPKQNFVFVKGANWDDGVCPKNVSLKSVPLDCGLEFEPTVGCVSRPGQASLALANGTCGDIHWAPCSIGRCRPCCAL